MRGFLTPAEIDRVIGTLASRQYGVVSRAQLAELGVPSAAIDRRIASERLIRVHRGVFAVGHRSARREARWLAAVLACTEGVVLSHRSAAALWEFLRDDGPLTDVTAARRPRHAGIAGHRASLDAEDRTVRRGIPVTSPARTLVDLAHVLDDDDLTRAVRQAQFQRVFEVPSMQRALQRRPSSVLTQLLNDIAPTQSPLEDRLLAICDRHGIPRPRTQQQIDARRVDFLWTAERLVVETDGVQAHATPDAFQADRTATNDLQLRGYTVLRFTHADVTRRPRAVAAAIAAALARREPQPGLVDPSCEGLDVLVQ